MVRYANSTLQYTNGEFREFDGMFGAIANNKQQITNLNSTFPQADNLDCAEPQFLSPHLREFLLH